MSKNEEHFKKIIKEIINDGGEGAIMRAARSPYEEGRSKNLVKIKASFGDKEGLVVSVGNDKSLIIKLPNEETFKVEEERVKIPTPPVGAIITFSYESYSKRLSPVNPFVSRIRSDLTWEDVVYQAKQDLETAVIDGNSGTNQGYGYWTKERMRERMEEFARKKGLDPHDPLSWYSLSAKDLKLEKNEVMLKKLKGFKNAVKVLFPETTFSNSEFAFSSWEKVENRRLFFENYAKLNGFDPLIPDNWYNQPMERIRAVKGAMSISYYHKNKMEQAIVDLFPNIGLDLSKFWQSQVTWRNPNNRRLFFINFTMKHNFDPLIPSHWYSILKSQILAEKGGSKVLARYKGSLSKAVITLFPNIGLDPLQFRGANSWEEEKDRRAFFIEYAKKNKFDPEVPENWYKQPREKIMASKGAYNVISYHNGTVPKALMELFPLLHWKKDKFFPRARLHRL